MKHDTTGRWDYLPLESEMTALGIKEGETYVLRRKYTIDQYIATLSTLEVCLAAERRPGTQVTRRWWDKECIDLKRAREAAGLVEVALEKDLETEERGGVGVEIGT